MPGKWIQAARKGTPTPAELDAGRFAVTRWSLVLRASRPGTPEADEALEVLCRTYWYPVYGYV
ncbi:MAG: RNA polymerase sigma factor, partial [Limisphaerales bacterium]